MQLKELFSLQDNVIFLNHGSFGACPKQVIEEYFRLYRELEAQPVDFLGRRFNQLMLEARTELGNYVGAKADNIVFIPNTTYGINVIANSLNLTEGDELITTNQEYGAVEKCWNYYSEKRGYRVNYLNLNLPVKSEEEIIQTFIRNITPRTKVIALSHITAPTALVMPVKKIIEYAQTKGIITVIDGAHAPGQLNLNLEALGADIYIGNCHKWMLSPKGSAFIYAKPHIQDMIEPLIISWGWQGREKRNFIEENQWRGTQDISAYLAVREAIRFMEKYNWQMVAEHCRSIASEVRKMFSDLFKSPPLAPENMYAQLVAHQLPANVDANKLKKRLYDKYRIEIPINEISGTFFIRASIQAYNSLSDYERLIDALKTEFFTHKITS